MHRVGTQQMFSISPTLVWDHVSSAALRGGMPQAPPTAGCSLLIPENCISSILSSTD